MQDALAKIYTDAAFSIPSACRRHAKAVFDDARAMASECPDAASVVAVGLKDRLAALSRPELAKLPPALFRRPGETVESVLKRCHAVFNTFN